MTNDELMAKIRTIEFDMNAVKDRFKAIDNPTYQDYLDRDEQIATLLKERDSLHEQIKNNVAEGKL
jgi:hypothetical protein